MPRSVVALLSCCLILPTVAACGPGGDTLEDLTFALELPNGGLTFDEEMPAFGLYDLDLSPVDPRVSIPDQADEKLGLKPAEGPLLRDGVLVAAWSDFRRGYGRFVGKWADQTGRVLGHVKGYYGKSKAHKGWVFFGKVVDIHGYAKGLLSGRFSGGHYRGVWVDDDGLVQGNISGVSRRNSLLRGVMVGRWDQRFTGPQMVASR